jgi:Arc/MetJ-type ribon-helix-helix transcriptional regulator
VGYLATSINVRLNDALEAELATLVGDYEKEIKLGRVTAADVVRAAIHDMYERRPTTTKTRKAGTAT